MNSYTLFKFAVSRNFEFEGTKQQRVYQFELQPGSPWEEIEGVLGEFKEEFLKLRDQAKEKEEADKAAANTEPLDADLVTN